MLSSIIPKRKKKKTYTCIDFRFFKTLTSDMYKTLFLNVTKAVSRNVPHIAAKHSFFL